MDLRTSDFDYDLPPELIAQAPLEHRNHSRLMILDRARHTVEHRRFDDLPGYLRSGDVLVLNETRVIPARVRGRKLPGGAAAEILLVREIDGNTGEWDAMIRPARRLPPGTVVSLDAADGDIVIQQSTSDGLHRVLLPLGSSPAKLGGEVPLPPYVHESLEDPERYQTVYSRHEGSVAAPTAGLHFTPALLKRIEAIGVTVAPIVLHVGPGTFRPVTNEDPRTHDLGGEAFRFPIEASASIQKAKEAGGRVICVGTTSVRVTETVMRDGIGKHESEVSGSTNLFILPGFSFRATDAMVTNFHLPRSTLLMLVAAFAGKDFIDMAYRIAVAERYRFYSFGDAMLIL
jgi:S-adenosylmethionine:tRNA ribosyltransferase-isomerase